MIVFASHPQRRVRCPHEAVAKPQIVIRNQMVFALLQDRAM
jgi:hypothetical protein